MQFGICLKLKLYKRLIQFSNAKINLGLFVGQKRPDGFHEISSLFLPVALYDVLEAMPSERVELQSFGIPIPEGENLVTQANKRLLERGMSRPYAWNLLKNIPIGAGMGGGSSNAASALQMMGPEQDLHDIALELGSDVPFFFHNQLCLVQGRGEEITPIHAEMDPFWVYIVNPGIHISTAEAYAGVDRRDVFPDILSIFKAGPSVWRAQMQNDFEHGIFRSYPEIAGIKDQLYSAGAYYASMSGSGSTVYGFFSEKPNPIEFRSSYFQRIVRPLI